MAGLASWGSSFPTINKGDFVEPDKTDTLVGYCLGTEDVPPLPRHVDDPCAELANALRPHADRPWFVSFSGGCDSSLVLAAATSFCRSMGRADPVPLTLRFPGLPRTDERRWQEMVVRSLGLTDWEILSIEDEFDIVGPLAGPMLRSAGPFVSAFIFSEQPLLAMARGGVLLNGEGGDEILGPLRLSPMLQVAHGLVHRRVPSRRSVQGVGRSLTPARLTAGRAADDTLAWWGAWLRPDVRADLVHRVAAEGGAGSWLPRRALRQHLASRMLVSGLRNLDELGRHFDVHYVRPLLAPRFAASLVEHGRWLRCRGRPVILDAHFSDLLPELLRHRVDKVDFNEVYFNQHSRAFAEHWDGSGLPDEVDATELRNIWLSDAPNGMTALLLQQAWLHSQTSTASAS